MSTEIKCLVCGNILSEDDAVCPVCKFPHISMLHGSEEEKAKIMAMAEEYRKEHWIPPAFSVYLMVYTNAPVPGETVYVPEAMETWTGIRQEKEEFILLGETDKLTDGIISWYPETFARQSEDISVKIRMEAAEGGKTLYYSVRMTRPSLDDFWRIGLLKKDRELKLALGSPISYTLSNPIPYDKG